MIEGKENITVTHFKNNESIKYLGITTSPNGNTTDTKESLHEFCVKFKLNLCKANITPDETNIPL